MAEARSRCVCDGVEQLVFRLLPQVEHLSKDERYSCLVFDNRGVSNSETPAGWYKTSEMAKDAFDLLESLVGSLRPVSSRRGAYTSQVSRWAG